MKTTTETSKTAQRAADMARVAKREEAGVYGNYGPEALAAAEKAMATCGGMASLLKMLLDMHEEESKREAPGMETTDAAIGMALEEAFQRVAACELPEDASTDLDMDDE
jgi:hypothetical protein